MKWVGIGLVLALDAAAVGFAAYIVYNAIRHPGKATPVEAWVKAAAHKQRMHSDIEQFLTDEAKRTEKE